MKTHILMIGPALTQNGGMATLEKLILKHKPTKFDVRLIVSHDEGSVLYRLMVFSRCFFLYLSALLFRRVDVVYVHVSDQGSLLRKYMIATLGFLFRKPVVMHTHGGGFPETHKKLPAFARNLLNKMFHACDAVIVLSKTWEDFYAQVCTARRERIHVLLNPVELPQNVPLREQRVRERVCILCCGRIRHEKGTYDLIRAFASLPKNLLDRCELILAGDGEVDAARALAIEVGVEKHVQLLGWVDELQREHWMYEADIFTLPSHFEGLPMAILEGMAAGLPILSTYVGGIPEIVIDQRNGLMIQAGDVEHLSRSLQVLIENRDLRLRLGVQSRIDSQAYDVKAYWEKLASIFESLGPARKAIAEPD